MMRLAQAVNSVQPVLVLAGRVVLGILLALVFSMLGIGIGWGLFVFFGAAAHATLLVLFMSGAGIGAGLGSYMAWVRIDRIPPWPVLLGILLAMMLAGIGGAWGGFQFGANQEVECCVGPPITPITYTALGATVVANAAALVMGIVQEIRARGGWTGLGNGAAGSAMGAS